MFETEAHKEYYEKVRGYMKELFGEMFEAREDAPVFITKMGSAVAHIAVIPWGENDAVVSVRAYLVTDVELTPELMEFLLKENPSFRFGAFGIDPDGDILFEHTIVGSTCDKNELKASILSVLMTADDYDDLIVQRFGGMRMLDKIKQVLLRGHPE
jgi:hypothetical protein